MAPEDMAYLARLVRSRSGLMLAPDKNYLVETRLGPVARAEGFASLEALVRAMRERSDERLIWAVTDALTTNETLFFRDRACFDLLRTEVLPALATKGREVRVWSAACSTGQEPYSVAMLVDELGADHPELSVDICASDISARVLEKAQAGVYTQFEVQRGLPIRSLVRHFEKVDDNWRIKPRLRQMVRWRQFNLLQDMRLLGRFDLVLCRNVLIYLDEDTRRGVLEQIARATSDGGYLVLGASETVLGLTEAFKPLPGKQGLYLRAPRTAAAA